MLIGALLAALLSIHITTPWRFIHDDNGAWTQMSGTAHIRAGLGATRGQDFRLQRSDGSLKPYLHHPPLYGLTAALAYRIAGSTSPTVTRLIPALFHLAGFAGVALLASVLFSGDRPKQLVALAVYAVVPMSAFFGKMPFNEAEGLCFVIWATSFLALHRERGGRPALVASLFLWVLAGMTSWTSYVILAFLAVLLLFEGRRLDGRRGTAGGLPVLLLVTAFLTGVAVLTHLLWAAEWQRPSMLDSAGYWAASSLWNGGLIGRLGKAFDLHRIYFANVPFLLFLIWTGLRIGELRGGLGRVSPARRFLLAGSAGCFLWSIIFLRQITVHAYGQFWYLPFESIAVGDMTISLYRRLASRPRTRLALAMIAVAGTLASSAWFLHYRYTTPGHYAIEASARNHAQYYTSPWEK